MTTRQPRNSFKLAPQMTQLNMLLITEPENALSSVNIKVFGISLEYERENEDPGLHNTEL